MPRLARVIDEVADTAADNDRIQERMRSWSPSRLLARLQKQMPTGAASQERDADADTDANVGRIDADRDELDVEDQAAFLSDGSEEAPLRAELLGVVQLDARASDIAAGHVLSTTSHAPERLLARLSDNERSIHAAYRVITDAVLKLHTITPAAEWFIDNHPLIEEQVRTARRHLPRGFSRELPRVHVLHESNDGPADDEIPRVYAIALDLVSHTHGRVDDASVSAFVQGYQRVAALKLGELWAVPIMLRLALIENLRRIVARITLGRRERARAGVWMGRLLRIQKTRRQDVILILADMVRQSPVLTDSFVAELASRLQAHGKTLALATAWLDQRLAERGEVVAHVFERVNQSQANDQVAIGNTIGGLRGLSGIDWPAFVERLSVVEQVLLQDPAGVYATLSFDTKDALRHAVERLAKKSLRTAHPRSELEVARAVVALAATHLASAPDDGSVASPDVGHIGAVLTGRFADELVDSVLHGAPGPTARMLRLLLRHRLGLYVGSIGALTVAGAVAVIAVFGAALESVYAPWWQLPEATPWRVALMLFGLGPVVIVASHLATTLVQAAVSAWAPPRLLPRLAVNSPVAVAHTTLVAVPAMLVSDSEVDDLIDDLELRYLANRDPNLYFALITDDVDADSMVGGADAALLARATRGVVRLNARYASATSEATTAAASTEAAAATTPRRAPFLLMHRRRRFNPREGVWMGWERKRGKLEDLNAALRGDRRRFAVIAGDATVISDVIDSGGVRYVIVLDADTLLPRDVARALVATIAHPENQACLDKAGTRVVRGYGILQPRVEVSRRSATRTPFSHLFAGEPGIDPYTRAVSDVYQDLFGEGSFVGKGIYDVDAVSATLGGALPDNLVLSHDLLEGGYARCGLVSDLTLIEDHPSTLQADRARRSRWIRGDWQLGAWLFASVPAGARAAPSTSKVKNPLTLLSRWKLFDNLRRSLVSPALLLVLLAGWAMPAVALWSMALVGGVMVMAGLLTALMSLSRRPADVQRRLYARDVVRSLWRQLRRDALTFVWLPTDAVLSALAIAQAMLRVLVTRRRMLEWRTARASVALDAGVVNAYRDMRVAPAAALMGAVVLLFGVSMSTTSSTSVVALSAVVFALWSLGPWLAARMGRVEVDVGTSLSDDDALFLRRVARRTWAFFADYVVEGDNHLPPDNVQVDPPVGIAHRTSPTNIGLSMLGTVAAFDLGYIGVAEVIDRTSSALRTLERLERYRGHFYNWYDTQSLAPLLPLYVSTVDSGNLQGHLLTLAAGLDGLCCAPRLRARLWEGLYDTASLLDGAMERTDGHAAPTMGEGRRIADHGRAICTAIVAAAAEGPATADGIRPWLMKLIEIMDEADDDGRTASVPVASVHVLAQLGQSADGRRLSEQRAWRKALRSQISAALAELDREFPFDAVGEDALRSEEFDVVVRRTKEVTALNALSDRVRALAVIDLSFLYDVNRRLFTIGHQVLEHKNDDGAYDLLASEARLLSFVAVAQGVLPLEHWFALGRTLTTSGGHVALLSWSGSMFEYLMPLLVMPAYPETLLDETARGVVKRQIEYGRDRGVAWGISESGYLKVDVHQSYQYRAFGVPGLGYKRGLADDLVIAPYASALALLVDPIAATANLRRLATEGTMGSHGFFEAVDHTPHRLESGQASALVSSFMAHHQGMTLLAIGAVLCGNPMQRRFMDVPAFRAADLLLQERVPRTQAVHPHPAESSPLVTADVPASVRRFRSPATAHPEVHLLSNGQYHVTVSATGGGGSRWRELAVTRFQADPTLDAQGSFLYLRDLGSGAVWSAAHQPTRARADRYEVEFSQGRATIARRDHGIESLLEISVSPEDDIELRRLTLKNTSDFDRRIEVTSYAEVVLAPPAHDAAHPAFSNLFVQTELVRDKQAIICTRRPRSKEEVPPTMLHLMAVHYVVQGNGNGHRSDGAGRNSVDGFSCETQRDAFIGRGRTLDAPLAMQRRSLTNTEGSVLDPITAIRAVVEVPAHQSVMVHVVTGVAEARERALVLVDKYRDRHIGARVFELSWTHSHVAQRRLDASISDIQLYERLVSHVLYPQRNLRADPAIIRQNTRSQSGMWGYGISGDLPVVLVRIGDQAGLVLVQHVLKAHAYWRQKGISVDLVIWNEDPSGYRQQLQDQLIALVGAQGEASLLDRPGGIFVRRGDQMSAEDKVLLQTVARVMLRDTAGTLENQLSTIATELALPPALFPHRDRRSQKSQSLSTSTSTAKASPAPLPAPPSAIHFANGHGGFSLDGREYVITSTQSSPTPSPWVNVLANPWFGTLVSEAGSAYTWCENAHSYRLTPWSNDPVTDPSGESIFVRDDDTGAFWSPTPRPAPGEGAYVTRHRFGSTVFEHTNQGIESSMTTWVAHDAPVKFVMLRLQNRSGRRRRLSLTASFDLVLGSNRAHSGPFVITERAPDGRGLLAINTYSSEFGQRTAFADVSEEHRSVSGDRTEVLGRDGSAARPASQSRTRLSGRTGACFDPCLATQVSIDLEAGAVREVVFTLGSGKDRVDALHLMERYRGVDAAKLSLDGVSAFWRETLSAVEIETPDAHINVLGNGWLQYQVISARLFGRTGFYQSGGAFGFRDQLQDTMALVHHAPDLLRGQLVRCAGRQFVEGDVQHWWHPPHGRGVRTRISDDLLWLPYAAARYCDTVGDVDVLDEVVGFLSGRAVRDDEDSVYDLPGEGGERVSLYEHCKRAIEHARLGVHGLPLMGTGDWNDGMNLVGHEGRGESVWLGFFFLDVLQRFSPIARRRGDVVFADRCDADGGALVANLDDAGWDGAWYRRAFFDDGTPLGSRESVECQIDSLPQSWAVLAGRTDASRATTAFDAALKRLVRSDLDVMQLFDPPFDGQGPEPGYVRGYVPGVRENGGQYTHAAVWAAMASAKHADLDIAAARAARVVGAGPVATADAAAVAAARVAQAWGLLSMLNPIHHGDSAETVARYKVEPYVVAADVSTNPQHAGRGGWTWYTGAAGWMYRLLLESLLGIEREGDFLRLSPKPQASWPSFRVHYRFHDTMHHITVRNRGGPPILGDVVADGVVEADGRVPLHRDGVDHFIEVDVGGDGSS